MDTFLYAHNVKWFDLCSMYLHSLEVVEGTATLYDNMPNATKEEHKQKMIEFDNFMIKTQSLRSVENKLNELWKLE